jgi:hypothetical protein
MISATSPTFAIRTIPTLDCRDPTVVALFDTENQQPGLELKFTLG